MPEDPLEFLKDRIARSSWVDRERIEPTSRFIDFGIDSVKALDLMVELEQAYGLSIPDRDMVEMETLQDVVDYVERRLGQ